MARKSKVDGLYYFDTTAPFRATQMPSKIKGNSHAPGTSNFLKHKGGEGRHFDYEIMSYLGQTKTLSAWIDTGTKAVESYPNYGKRGGKSARVSAQRMIYGMCKEGLLVKVA